MDRREFLRTAVIGGGPAAVLGPAVFAKSASAETYNNIGLFGGQLLGAAGKKLHIDAETQEVKTVQQIIDSLGNGGFQTLYTAANVANAFVAAWGEAEGSAYDRVIQGAAEGDLSPVDTLVNGRRDQGLLQTIAYQHSNIIVEAIRDVDQRQGLRRGYDQIADEGVKALVTALHQNRDHAEYETYKTSIETMIAHIETAYIEGANLFANVLRADLTAAPEQQAPAGTLAVPKLQDI